MKLVEMSKTVYLEDERAFKERIEELIDESTEAEDARARDDIERRINTLKGILEETRRLKHLTANYYACRRTST